VKSGRIFETDAHASNSAALAVSLDAPGNRQAGVRLVGYITAGKYVPGYLTLDLTR